MLADAIGSATRTTTPPTTSPTAPEAVARQLAGAPAPHAAVIGAIDRVAPLASPVRQGELSALRQAMVDHAGGERAITQAADPALLGGLERVLGGGSDYSWFDRIVEIIRGITTPLPMHLNKLIGPEAAGIVSQSPTLTKQLAALEKQGWQVEYGTAGGGTFADRTTKTITIDPNGKNDARGLVQSLAHEVGHASYDPKFDYSSSKTYLHGALGDEGEATLNNIAVQREIVAAGGPDIGVAGTHRKEYEAIYDAYKVTGNRAAARDAIGRIFGNGEHTSTSGQTYRQYYLEGYHRAFPHRK